MNNILYFKTMKLFSTNLFSIWLATIICVAIANFSSPTLQANDAIETNASFAFIQDFTTDDILLSINAHERMYPASMTKMMTAYLAFIALDEGRIKLTDKLTISQKAWRKGGSKMFVQVGSQVSVDDILHGIIVQSGNDASIALAEFLGGDEDNFAKLMNHEAEKLGMFNTHFTNASGWPDEQHYTTAADLGLLARAIIKNFPDLYTIYSNTSFTYNGIAQNNRNPLLYKNSTGADGLKTGYTEASGYGLTASAVQNNQRLIMVINGLSSSQDRADEARRLFAWAFANFRLKKFFTRSDTILDIPVWLGDKQTVKAQAANHAIINVPVTNFNAVNINVSYATYPTAPIKVGDVLGEIAIEVPNGEKQTIPLIASENISRQSFFAQLLSKLALLSGDIETK